MKNKTMLSPRMQQVADYVVRCGTVADVGCDHGYISIYLLQNGIAEHVIAMDLRNGPLSRAEVNRNNAGLQTRMECRLSDGLDKLSPNEADAVVIAGMGGPLMIDILERGRKNESLCNQLVLQPQSDIPSVRRYLHSIGYRICREAFLIDEGKYYTVIHAEASDILNAKKAADERYEKTLAQDGAKLYSEVEYIYGKYLLESGNPVLKQYLEEERKQWISIQENLQRQLDRKESAKIRIRLEELELQLKRNEEAFSYYG